MARGVAKVHRCEYCDRAFARREHLQRHKSSCRMLDIQRAFTCSICAKSFSRKDVMNRHVRALHDPAGSWKSLRKRSCVQCANLKIKCTGGPPVCSTCKERNTSCFFDEDGFPRRVSDSSESLESGNMGRGGDILSPYVQAYGDRQPHNPQPNLSSPSNFDAGLAFLANTVCDESQSREAGEQLLSMQAINEQQDRGANSSRQFPDETLTDNFLSDCSIIDGGMFSLDWLHTIIPESQPRPPSSHCDPTTLPADVPFPKLEPVRAKSSWIRFWQPEEEPTVNASAVQLTLNVHLPATQIPISEHTRTNLIKILNASLGTGMRKEIDLNTLPSRDVLGHCLKLYFKHFDPILPIFHVPTFDPDQTTEVLLAVMIGFGSAYADVEGAQTFANTMVELAVHTLTWMGDVDPRYRKNMFYIVALLLISYYTVGAGDKNLLSESESLRSHLIVNARYMGLFDPQNWTDDNDLQACWLKWRDEELRKRVAWSIFTLDSSISIFTSVRPCMSLLDLKNNLPCDVSLWTAPTAHTWAGFFPWTGHSPRGQPFLRTFGELVSGKLVLSTLSPYSKRICAQALQRLFREMKELESSSMSRILSLQLENHFSSGGAIMKALNSLLDSVEEAHDFVDYVNYASIVSITHYTSLWAPRGMLDQLVSLLRSERNDRAPILENVEKEFSNRPVEARRLAWNAAQILTLFRYRCMKSPIETMRIFMAGYYIYMFSRHFSNSDGVERNIVRLDDCSWIDKSVPYEWISYGGSANFGSITLCKANCKAVLNLVLESLGALRMWGLSQHFYHILVQVAEDGDLSSGVSANERN